jgi:hypothetical protein
LVLRLHQETYAHRLHVHGTDRTRRHPTHRSPNYQVPNLRFTIFDPLYQVSYSYHNPHR